MLATKRKSLGVSRYFCMIQLLAIYVATGVSFTPSATSVPTSIITRLTSVPVHMTWESVLVAQNPFGHKKSYNLLTLWSYWQCTGTHLQQRTSVHSFWWFSQGQTNDIPIDHKHNQGSKRLASGLKVVVLVGQSPFAARIAECYHHHCLEQYSKPTTIVHFRRIN